MNSSDYAQLYQIVEMMFDVNMRADKMIQTLAKDSKSSLVNNLLEALRKERGALIDFSNECNQLFDSKEIHNA